MLRLILAAALGAALAQSAHADACRAGARQAPRDARIGAAIAEVHRQHQLFGGQTIERNGGMFRVGHHEAEWERAPGETLGTWQRVAAFWRALSDTEPPQLMTSQGWVDRAQASPTGNSALETAAREALLRAAIVDTPWSAAFLSYVMKTAGFSRAEFAFSDSHAEYVQAALDASAAEAQGRETAYAYRACDLATTPPRAGDLLCATRAGTAGTTRFTDLAAAIAARGVHAFPMHCELVVRADAGGDAKLETIGGNVVQSVTLSRMTLNAAKVLGGSYVGAPSRTHLSRRPWLVLLQARN